MPLQCRIIKRTDEKTKPSAGEFLKGATLLDISGGGLAFMSKISLSVDDIALFSFVLQKQKMIVKGKIVAILQQDGKSGIYFKHRVAFYSAKPADTERIVKFIYEKQRERMQLG
jgi:c-di-GMP-binding flagellar brake protein YcgR